MNDEIDEGVRESWRSYVDNPPEGFRRLSHGEKLQRFAEYLRETHGFMVTETYLRGLGLYE